MALRNARGTFIETLQELAAADPKIILVTCDVGFSYLETFANKFPNQYLNAGVTEQTATGLCAGLAYSGWKPYFYSMINFVLMRNYEQVRNDICFGNANVKLIGVRGSVHYKFLGFSHNLEGNEHEEDLLKNLPNIKRCYPDSPDQVRNEILKEYQREGPSYLRL